MSQDTHRCAASKPVASLKTWLVCAGAVLTGVTVNYITRNSLGSSPPELKEPRDHHRAVLTIVRSIPDRSHHSSLLCGWLIDGRLLKIGFL